MQLKTIVKSYPLFPDRPDVDINEDLGLPTTEHLLFSYKATGMTYLDTLRTNVASG